MSGYYHEGDSDQDRIDFEPADVDGDDELSTDCGHPEIRRNIQFVGGRELCAKCFEARLLFQETAAKMAVKSAAGRQAARRSA